MLAKIYLIGTDYHMFLSDSTHRKLTPLEMHAFLKTFRERKHYGNLNNEEAVGILSPGSGELVAQVTEERDLCILSPAFFPPLLQADTPTYLTVEEYAEKVGRSVNMVGKLCRAGRLPGAYQQGARWLIPENAPYPSTKKIICLG